MVPASIPTTRVLVDIVTSREEPPVAWQLLDGMRLAAAALGWELLIPPWDGDLGSLLDVADGAVVRWAGHPCWSRPGLRPRSILLSGSHQQGRRQLWHDSAAIAAAAVAHLQGLGIHRCLVRDDPQRSGQHDRLVAFTTAWRAAGGQTQVYSPTPAMYADYTIEREAELFAGQWRRRDPTAGRPGLVTYNTFTARRLLSCANRQGIAVPQQLAILALEDRETVAISASPTLSAVACDDRRLGIAAIEALQALLIGREPELQPIPPTGVQHRGSTSDEHQSGEPALAAWRALLADCQRDWTSEELAALAGLSRRSLERHFLAMLGHSPGEELRRQRLRRGADLLVTSTDPIARIAAAVGFRTASHFSAAFRAQFGCSPGSYRTEQTGRGLSQDHPRR